MEWIIYCLRKSKPENYRTRSAIPIIGSLLVVLMLRTLGSIPAAKVIGIALIVVDSGGIHWALAGLPYILYRQMRKRKIESSGMNENSGDGRANRGS